MSDPRFMPGDWVAYNGSYPKQQERIGQVVEVNDDGTNCYGRRIQKVLVHWYAGFFTQRETWVQSWMCKSVPPPEDCAIAVGTLIAPIWEIPEVAAVIEAYDLGWRTMPEWPYLAEAIGALRKPEPPLRSEDV